MLNKYVAFDLETASDFPEDGHWYEMDVPMNISIIGSHAVTPTAEYPLLWYGRERGAPTQSLPAQTVDDFISYLESLVDDGYCIVSWNGLGFDFPALAHLHPQFEQRLYLLARYHWDIQFQVYLTKGYPIGLGAASYGLGLGTKMLAGEQAPYLWRSGAYQIVQEYVAKDAALTADLVRAIAKVGKRSNRGPGIIWTSKAGNTNFCPIHEVLLVNDLLDDLPPDQSWMSEPIPREGFTWWMDALVKQGWYFNRPVNGHKIIIDERNN